MSNSVLSKIKHIFTRNEVDYFMMFVEGAKISLKAAVALQTAFADELISESELRKIREIEHEGDKLVLQSLKLLEDAFITPIDQEDLLDILKCIEEVTDHIDDVSAHCFMLDIRQSDPFIDDFIRLIVKSCEQMLKLMEYFHDYRKLNLSEMNKLIITINVLEEEADGVYLRSMRSLFTQPNETITIIRKQGIYLRLEDAMDCIEHAANSVRKLLISKL